MSKGKKPLRLEENIDKSSIVTEWGSFDFLLFLLSGNSSEDHSFSDSALFVTLKDERVGISRKTFPFQKISPEGIIQCERLQDITIAEMTSKLYRFQFSVK